MGQWCSESQHQALPPPPGQKLKEVNPHPNPTPIRLGLLVTVTVLWDSLISFRWPCHLPCTPWHLMHTNKMGPRWALWHIRLCLAKRGRRGDCSHGANESPPENGLLRVREGDRGGRREPEWIIICRSLRNVGLQKRTHLRFPSWISVYPV